MDRRKFLKAAGAAGAAGLTAGCIGQFGSQPFVDGSLKFLMSPTEPQDQMMAQYQPIKERLNKKIDKTDKVNMKYAANYAAALNALNSGTADIAETGPFAAALGVKSDKVEIALQRKGYGSWTYVSNIVTREDSDIQSLQDLEGKKIAFADPLSASGSLYPIAMLKDAGLAAPESPGNGKGADYEPQWSSHAAAKEALMSGQAAAAGVGYFIVRGENSQYAEGIRPLKRETGIPRAPIVLSPKLSDGEQQNIKDVFTGAPDTMYMGADGKEGTEDDLWFSGVREASLETYKPVIEVADKLGYSAQIFEN
ncbi:MAG: phosphate/phosphite/phosphonate ABC transporter substrate-binding protein [Halobacterium sp.]